MLTVETNIMTSKFPRERGLCGDRSAHIRSAVGSVVSLLMVVLFPVSDSVRRVLHPGPSPETDTSTLKTGEELVCVPVRIFQLILHAKKNLRHLMITFFFYSSPCVHSTGVIGKLYVPCSSAFHLLRVVTPPTPSLTNILLGQVLQYPLCVSQQSHLDTRRLRRLWRGRPIPCRDVPRYRPFGGHDRHRAHGHGEGEA
jgi:hypothetical protein